MNNSVPLQQALSVVPDRHALYVALLRNQVVMPPYKDSIVTTKFMQSILEGRNWCLRSTDVKYYRVCADPPSRKELASVLHNLMVNCDTVDPSVKASFLSTAQLILKHPPSAHWTLLVIAAMDPDNALFARDYVKPKPLRDGKPPGQFVTIFDGFFDGLPQATRSKHSRGLTFMTKEQREQEKVEKMELRLSEMQAKLEKEKARVANNNNVEDSNNSSVPVNPLLSNNTEEEKTVPVSNNTGPNLIGNADE